MQPRSRGLLLALAVSLLAAAGSGCGGGPGVQGSSAPSSIQVSVSAGAPVFGATVTVYAIDDRTGVVDPSVGAGGVLGSAGPTDAAGRAAVALTAYAGPIQIVASGPTMYYADP